MRISFTLDTAGTHYGTFDAWHEDGVQYARVHTYATGVDTTVSYTTVPHDPWVFIALALRDLELKAIRDRLESAQRALAAAVHAS